MSDLRGRNSPDEATASRRRSLGSAMLSFVMRFVELGVDPTSPPSTARWIRTINLSAMAALVLSAWFAAFYAVLDVGSLWPVVVMNIICVAGYVEVLKLDAGGRPRRASWLLLGTGWANTLIPAAALGANSGVYLFLILVPMIGVLTSPPNDRLMRVLVIGFGVLAFALMPMVFPNAPVVLEGSNVEVVLFVTSALGVALFGSLVALYYRWLVDSTELALAEANARSERLLLNILPEAIAARLKTDESPIADRVDDVTVLFADLVDSTPLSEQLAPDALVALLNGIFSEFDELSETFGLEKITTIGDEYMAVAGLPVPRADHAEAAADMALAMCAALEKFHVPDYGQLTMRFGLASGPVVAGVIGKRKFRYDLWGDTVNTASRMQTHGEPGRIHVTGEIQRTLDRAYVFEPRGEILVKGKGPMETFFLTGRRDAETLGDPGERPLAGVG